MSEKRTKNLSERAGRPPPEGWRFLNDNDTVRVDDWIFLNADRTKVADRDQCIVAGAASMWDVEEHKWRLLRRLPKPPDGKLDRLRAHGVPAVYRLLRAGETIQKDDVHTYANASDVVPTWITTNFVPDSWIGQAVHERNDMCITRKLEVPTMAETKSAPGPTPTPDPTLANRAGAAALDTGAMLLLGAKEALAAEGALRAADALVSGVRSVFVSTFGERWPAILDTNTGRRFLSVVIPAALHGVAGTFEPYLPVAGALKGLAAAATQGAQRTAVHEVAEFAKPVFVRLVTAALTAHSGPPIAQLASAELHEIPAGATKTTSEGAP